MVVAVGIGIVETVEAVAAVIEVVVVVAAAAAVVVVVSLFAGPDVSAPNSGVNDASGGG